jgi:hypothetical protein
MLYPYNTVPARFAFLLLVALSLSGKYIYGQNGNPVNFGKIDKTDFVISPGLINANASAIILSDVGTTKFEGNTKGWFSYIFKRQKRIKIIDKKGFDLATVAILLYRNSEAEEKAEEISASSYNLEDGKVSVTRLSSKDIFTEKADKNHTYKKFTLPNVKEGSIIEYSYIVKSDFIFSIPSWEFQDKSYPTLWSEYNIAMPGMLGYMSFFQGYHKFFINKGTEGFQSFYLRRQVENSTSTLANREEALTVSSPIVKQKWVIRDIPPFNAENYITSPNNYIDKMSFQLHRTYDGQKFHDVANNWKIVAEDLMKREDFGQALTGNNRLLDETLEKVVNPTDTELEAARKIYYYIQTNYTCTDHHDLYINTTLQDVIKKKTGGVADLNLLMIAMLKRKTSSALPVLLSTREHGRISRDYPEIDRLNYVIGKIKIDSSEYFLDASIPYLPFGKLPANCYNGYARVVSEDTTAVYLEEKMHKENSSVNVFFDLNDQNEMEGSYTKHLGLYETMETKKVINTSPDAYKSYITSFFPEEFQITRFMLDSANNTGEDDLTLKIDFKVKAFEDADIIYFTPILGHVLKTNPFFADERTYPVEMPYASSENYILNMSIPKGYKVEEMPRSTRMSLNENEGLFEYLVSRDGSVITIRCNTLIRETFYRSEDYQSLRDFFSQVVKKHSEQLVFKKIK